MAESDDAASFVAFLACYLGTLAEEKDKAVGKRRTLFDSLRRPSMGLATYLMCMYEDIGCSPCCYLIAYVYLSRFCNKEKVHMHSLNAHRLLLTSLVVAVKFMEDECHSNSTFAEIGGISTAELNTMELEFLSGMGFRASVTQEEFLRCRDRLQIIMDKEFPASSAHFRLSSIFPVFHTITSSNEPQISTA